MMFSDALISLDALPSLLAACLVLLLGTVLCQSVPALARCSIPSPVVGCILFAIAAAVLLKLTGQRIAMTTSARSGLLVVFFASLGLTPDLRQLLRSEACARRASPSVTALGPALADRVGDDGSSSTICRLSICLW